MAVVKANAYGHSVDTIAPLLEKSGADFFGVSNIQEAVDLRKCGIKKEILILGYTPVEAVELLYENNISQAIFSREYASMLSSAATEKNIKIKVHIKLDTGMGRIGFDCRDEALNGISDAISSAKMYGFIFKGIFTHFSDSDRTQDSEDGFTNKQFNLFKSAVNSFENEGLNPGFVHCCNSAAFCIDNDKHLNLCRPGIILYGLTPNPDLTLKESFVPVMTLKSVVSMVKEINEGDTVSYGRTFKADKKMKIATVTAGYADGYPRLLSNKGYVIINGKKASIVGRVCMDQFSVDVSHIPDVKQDDEVILFGKELPVEELAKICGTINYEIVCGVSQRVPRIIK